MSYEKLSILLIFFLSYLLFLIKHERKHIFALAAVIILLLLGLIPPSSLVKAINWNVLGIFIGTLIIAEGFSLSQTPAVLAQKLTKGIHSLPFAMLIICALSGFISAFVENVATVLIVAPICLALARRAGISPVPFMIGLAISSNLQGTATLIGDPPSMLLAAYTGMDFNDFFILRGKLSIFFAVELAALASLFVLFLLFRRHPASMPPEAESRILSLAPSVILLLLIVTLALSPLINKAFPLPAGTICLFYGLVMLLWALRFQRAFAKKMLTAFDYKTTLFLASIFILVHSLQQAGLLSDLANLLKGLTGNSIFATYTLLVWVSVLISGFVDNIPYTVAMLPVALSLAKSFSIEPTLFAFGVVIGASIGGNITPIGASANIVSVGILARNGYKVSFSEFLKIGLPFTLTATLAAYTFIWFIWR